MIQDLNNLSSKPNALNEVILEISLLSIENDAPNPNSLEIIKQFHNSISHKEYDLAKCSVSQKELFLDSFKSICEKLEENEDNTSKSIIQSPAKYAKFLLNEALTEPRAFVPTNFTQLVINNWDTLYDYEFTYHALFSLYEICSY